MSADKWAKCPICHGCAKFPDGIFHLYGELSVDEWIELSDKIKSASDNYTVRMDYEVYMTEDGCIKADISAHCSECGADWGIVKKEKQTNYYYNRSD